MTTSIAESQFASCHRASILRSGKAAYLPPKTVHSKPPLGKATMAVPAYQITIAAMKAIVAMAAMRVPQPGDKS